ncbi:hypothetical protein F0562_036235 [Nyssa sinensis]|uniref:Uncharacterized protein n=1 Tax=Nyssa sinensis TaxID=561372 RepID=A0A5J5AE78_9ASTE|nr:hypothetical protein F0562_036235 [Nyssa sinensis]
MAHLELSILWRGSTKQPHRPTYLKFENRVASKNRQNSTSGSLKVPHRDRCSRDRTQLRPGANQPPLVATFVTGDSFFGQPRALAHGRPVSTPDCPTSWSRRGVGATQCVTPRQTCPRPNGFGRNLRSKTRWFMGFCNSHQVSHFTTFFIDARAEISVAESCFVSAKDVAAAGTPREQGVSSPSFVVSSLAQIAPGFVFWAKERARTQRSRRGELAPPRFISHVHGSFCWAGFDNDPSAGSPTETLLRLLLPLNDKAQCTSCDVTGGEPPTSPQSEHFTEPFNR